METVPYNESVLSFVPSEKLPTSATPIKFYAFLIPVLCLIPLSLLKFYAKHRLEFFIVTFITLLFVIVDLLTRRFVRKIIIDSEAGELEADYVNSIGQQKKMSISIHDAHYEYKLQGTKSGSSWQLHMYNSYFKNRLALRESKKNGFTKAQLDELNTIILSLRK